MKVRQVSKDILDTIEHPERVCKITLEELRLTARAMRVEENDGGRLTPKQVARLRRVVRKDVKEHLEIVGDRRRV